MHHTLSACQAVHVCSLCFLWTLILFAFEDFLTAWHEQIPFRMAIYNVWLLDDSPNTTTDVQVEKSVVPNVGVGISATSYAARR